MSKKKITNNGRARKGVHRYIDYEFAKILDEIKKMRIILGKDDPNNIKADWRITLAMARHPDMRKQIMEDIINSPLD
jgi:hypothetical protein